MCTLQDYKGNEMPVLMKNVSCKLFIKSRMDLQLLREQLISVLIWQIYNTVISLYFRNNLPNLLQTDPDCSQEALIDRMRHNKIQWKHDMYTGLFCVCL
jgi:hypothetical protein